ncbi:MULTISPECIES: energy-coupling factor transporter transmembrane component T family protein [unclassified Candidatus Frackibacter]|uniref:energy-coupling factor transporter transmembrane component T family protein n=1 Tax=unclassified Candidatus Frackibacter TaxID=2648818 RepID=UPI0007952413|nr:MULTISPECIES: energy-coupling factor transporter transmembrane component T [unclassified Candidatus Frackibacter]KXS45796.1 MAG: cobalt/nickel transport system permease protein [Candidatus Frackibacter sp. T328-2]SDC22770.1 energy-coupling factor transport system permease protein [Candidatus Frackibacter sp. WG11]SEM49120.1 energy-coupling factor transport system permease protein [Candidatus Frackibacter sp. WG12]SFL50725.1 energy-coupling factor transport system permease protein [Candidatus
MLNDIMLGQYLDRDSIVHSLDPRIKILLVILFIIVLFISKTLLGYAVLGGFIIISTLIAKIEFKYILKSLKPLLFIISLTLIIHLFLTKGGEVIWEWKFLSIEEKGLNLGLFMAARLIFLITFTSLLTLTTSPLELTDGLEKLLNPFKRFGVPAHELAMMMTIALRFIPTLLEESEKILKAQKARGADFESGNLIQKAKSLIPLLVPLFVSAFRRADDLALAMEARCYRGGEGRTRMNELHLSRADYLIGGATAIFLIFVAILI